MATFFSNTKINNWGTSVDILGTLTGNVTRSGNTVTLSNIVLSWWFSSTAGVFGTETMHFTVNGQNSSEFNIGAGYTSGTIGVPNSSFGVSTTQTSASIGWSCSNGGLSGSFTVTFPSGATGPSGGSCSFVSSTWNSITIKGKVTNWGTGYSNPSRHFGVGGGTITSTSGGRREENVDGSATTDATVTINNSDSALDGGINIRGCLAYRAYMWYGTSVGSSAVPDGGTWTTRYTPPAPLQSITAGTQGYSGTNVTVPITITGGNSTNNNNVTVTTQYQYKVGSGSLSSWTSAGTGTPWTAKSVTLSVASNSSITVNARQVYQSQNSETKVLTFKTKPLTPSLSNATTSFGSSGISVDITQNIGGWADVLTGHITITASDGTSKTTTTTFSSSPTTQTKTVQISGDWVRPATTYTITAYTSNTAGNSNTTTLTFRTRGTYVPYSSLSKSPLKVFASSSGLSKEALKIYVGDSNNQSKRVYMKG